MASSGIPGVTNVRYVQEALLLDLSDGEASAEFSRMIEESLRSWFTQFNFFIHNLAQMRFNNNSEDGAGGGGHQGASGAPSLDGAALEERGELLSFIPKKYS